MPSRETVFAALSGAMAARLAQWARGERFDRVRSDWLDRAAGVGMPIRVRTGEREIEGLFGAIDAEGVGKAVVMIGGGRNATTDTIDHAVGIILEVKVGQKVDAGSVLCRLYHTSENNLEEAAEIVEDSFRISSNPPELREIGS